MGASVKDGSWLMDRKPTVERLYRGFPSRIQACLSRLDEKDKKEFEKVRSKHGLVMRWKSRYEGSKKAAHFTKLLNHISELNDELCLWEKRLEPDSIEKPISSNVDDETYLSRVSDAGEPGCVKGEKR